MPSFLYPAFLIGALAAAIPVLLHLLRNQQAPEVRFSAVRLLRGVRVEHAQRRRIRDWLLLALRVSALLLLALAFARPFLGAGSGAAGQETLLVIDRSASTSAPDVWTKVQTSAMRALEAVPANEAAGVIAFDDKAELIVEPTLDRGALRGAIEALRPGVGGTRYPTALARAVSVLEDSHRGSGRIVLVSDLPGSPADVRVSLPESVALEVLDASAPVENVALLGARAAEAGIVTTIRNDGTSPRRVRVEIAGAAASGTAIDLPPGQTVEAAVPWRMREGEASVRLASTDGNAFTWDDQRHVTLGGAHRPRVLLVGGAGDAFFVDAALKAGGDAPDFDVASVTGQGLTRALTTTPAPEAVFVLSARGVDRGAREGLLTFVRNGGGLLVAASDPGFSSLVQGVDISAPRGDDAILSLASFDTRHPLFRHDGAIGEGLADAQFTRAWRVRAKGWQMLARFDDGAGALFEHAEGRGRLLLFASDLNRGWNDLPVQPAFVPLVQEIARYLAPRAERRDYTPGTLPAGARVRLGFVELASGRRVAVNPDVRESDPARMSAAVFGAAVKRRPDRQVEPAVARRRVEATERGQALWRYGLMLMFATLVAEGIVGSRVRRA
jgi:hypothetical protein